MNITSKQEKFWEILKYGYDRDKILKNDADVIRAIKFSRKQDAVIEPLGNYMFKLAGKMTGRVQFVRYSDLMKEEMRQYACLMMLVTWLKFDTDKSDHPIAYFTIVCENAFMNVIHAESRQQGLKKLVKEKLDEVG